MSEIFYIDNADRLSIFFKGQITRIGGNMTVETLRPIFDTAMANGLNLWDTAYAYGMGTSEKTLAGFLRNQPRGSYLVSDKFTPKETLNKSPRTFWWHLFRLDCAKKSLKYASIPVAFWLARRKICSPCRTR